MEELQEFKLLRQSLCNLCQESTKCQMEEKVNKLIGLVEFMVQKYNQDHDSGFLENQKLSAAKMVQMALNGVDYTF